MDVPGIVREHLGDERRMTSVNVGGDDRVYVTPPRTLVYHASGLFSRESIDEYSHDARRFDVSADRREATFAFEYDDGVEAFSVPRERIETVLPPVLAGVLRTTGLIDDDESVEESYRFGERTIVVTEAQTLTSVGEAVWDRDHESYGYDEVTDLGFEDGDLVVEIDGESRRIELGDDGGREAYETVETALCSYHDVGSVEELHELPRTTEREQDRGEETASAWGPPGPSGTEPSDRTPERTNPVDDAEPESKPASSPPPSSPAPGDPLTDPIPEAPDTRRSDASDTTSREPSVTAASGEAAEVADELDALRETVEHQAELLERNHELLERLVDGTAPERVSDDQ